MPRQDHPDGWIDYFSRTTELPAYFQYRATLLNKVKRYSKQGDMCLEIGAGRGWSSASLGLMKRNIVALDIEGSILKRIQELSRKLSAGVEVICADMKQLPFIDRAFRVVFSQGVLEHFDDDEICEAIKEQLRVGEIVVIDVPTNKAQGHPGAYGGERWLTWKHWKNLVGAAGAHIHLLFGSSPTLYAYLLPFGLWKVMGYRFSSNLGIVCSRLDSNAGSPIGGFRERLVD